MWAKTALCDQEDESVRRAVKVQRYFAFYAVTFHAIYTIASPTFDRSQLPGPPNGPGRTVSLNSMDTVFFFVWNVIAPACELFGSCLCNPSSGGDCGMCSIDRK